MNSKDKSKKSRNPFKRLDSARRKSSVSSLNSKNSNTSIKSDGNSDELSVRFGGTQNEGGDIAMSVQPEGGVDINAEIQSVPTNEIKSSGSPERLPDNILEPQSDSQVTGEHERAKEVLSSAHDHVTTEDASDLPPAEGDNVEEIEVPEVTEVVEAIEVVQAIETAEAADVAEMVETVETVEIRSLPVSNDTIIPAVIDSHTATEVPTGSSPKTVASFTNIHSPRLSEAARSRSRHNLATSDRTPFHTYDHYFSSSSLSRLAENPNTESTPLVRPISQHRSRNPSLSNLTVTRSSTFQLTSRNSSSSFRQPGHHTRSPSQVSLDNSHFLARTGSRVWEDVRESKGQSWLTARASSTSLGLGDSSDEEDKVIPSHLRSFNSRPRLTRASSIDEDDSDDGILHIGSKNPRTLHRNESYLADEEDVDPWYREDGLLFAQEEDTLDAAVKHNIYMDLVVWVLGVGNDGDLMGPKGNVDRALNHREVIRRRDQEQEPKLDAVWTIALIGGLFGR